MAVFCTNCSTMIAEGRKMGTHDEGETRSSDAGLGEEEAALYRVVVPKQKVVVRINGLRPDGAEGGYLTAVRPYGVIRTAWAIWREVPGVEAKGALSLARRVRREGEAVVLMATHFLADHVRGMLLARHGLAARLERIG